MTKLAMERKDQKICAYIEYLKLWNAKLNLVSRETLDDVYNRHILDCMQISRYLKKDYCIIDVGSGAGLPGVILSILGYHHVLLCEQNFKKCVFLHDMKVQLGLDYDIYNGDIYDYYIISEESCRVVLVARAFASLSRLIDVMTQLKVERGVFHKGEHYRSEIAEAQKLYDFKYEVKHSETNEQSVILIINLVRRK